MDGVSGITSTVGQALSVNTQSGKAIASPPTVSAPATAGSQTSAAASPEVEQSVETRGELDVDDAAASVVSRVVDANTGEVVSQLPSDTELRLRKWSRQMVGSLLNKIA